MKQNTRTQVLISPQPDQEGNKLQRQKILMFIYPIYNNNWRNISTIYIYKTTLESNEIFSPSKYIGKQVGLRTNQQPARCQKIAISTVAVFLQNSSLLIFIFTIISLLSFQKYFFFLSNSVGEIFCNVSSNLLYIPSLQ